MINTKQDYESPTTNVFEIRFESSILQASLRGAGGNGFSDPKADIEDGTPGIFW